MYQVIKRDGKVVDFNIRLNGIEELETLIVKIKKDPKIVDVFRTNA